MQMNQPPKNINHRGAIMQAMKEFTGAFGADHYHVLAIHALEKHRVAFREHLRNWEMADHALRLAQLNREGFHIFARPVGRECVLLDDLGRGALAGLAQIKPCALVETSPGNYQAWLTLPQAPSGPEHAAQVYRWLAAQFGADMASAKPGQVGRLPGFFNVKEKHRENGVFPLVVLHRAERRYALLEPSKSFPDCPPCGLSFSGAGTVKSGGDRSGYDFQFACLLVGQGKSDEKILEILQRKSLKARERRDGNKYLIQTIAAARKKVEKW